MAEKGSKMSSETIAKAEMVETMLKSIDGTSMKKMFGGFGIFHEDKMFGLLDTKGKAFIRGDKSRKDEYLGAGRVQHSRMPYFSLTDHEMNDAAAFETVVKEAIKLSKD